VGISISDTHALDDHLVQLRPIRSLSSALMLTPCNISWRKAIVVVVVAVVVGILCFLYQAMRRPHFLPHGLNIVRIPKPFR
jgi:hypothetical protein